MTSFARLIGAALCWTTAVVLITAPAGAQSTFHGDVARTGVYDSPAPAQPSVKWTFKTGGPIVGSPAIEGGVVYIASLDAHMYALDAATGQEKWKFKSRTPIASTPAVHEGVLYFVSSAGSLAALDAATGATKWVYAVDYERRFEAKGLNGYPPTAQTIPDAWDLFTSSPAVAAGKVFFGAGDGNVYAVDIASRQLLWKFPTGDVVHASPTVVDNVVYIGSFDGSFYAIDAETGQQKWAFQGGQDPAIHNQVGFQSSAAVVDGTVYVGSRDARVYAFDARTGRKKWDYPTSKSWVNTTPAVRDGLVYAATSDSSRVFALDAKTGRLRFNFDAKAFVFSSPALAGGHVLIGAHNGRMHALDAKTGALVWAFQTDGAKADPLKVLSADGSLNRAAFTPVFGDFQDMYIDHYRFVSVGAIMSSPAVLGGVVYFGSMDGTVYALG